MHMPFTEIQKSLVKVLSLVEVVVFSLAVQGSTYHIRKQIVLHSVTKGATDLHPGLLVLLMCLY